MKTIVSLITQQKIVMKSDKIIEIGNQTLVMTEYETIANERSVYGLNVYIAWDIKCSLWEYLMPSDTIREEQYRRMPYLWKDFIYGDKDGLLELFVSELSRKTGLTLHIVSKETLPNSVYEPLHRKGARFDEMVSLIVYGNNC